MRMPMRSLHAWRWWTATLQLVALYACSDGKEGMSKRDAGADAGDVEPGTRPLTACPDVPFDHNDMPCVGDFLCTTPVKCCNAGTLCS